MTDRAASPQLEIVSHTAPRRAANPDLGDVPEVCAIYDHESEYVFRTLARLGVTPRDLSDAVHDVFVVVHRRIAEYDTTRPVRAWLFGIARRVAAAHRRKAGRETVMAEPMSPASVQPRVDAQLQARDLLWRALSSLDDDKREAFVLHDLEGYTAPEVAEILEVPVNTVYSRVRVARQRLSEFMEAVRSERHE